MRAQLHPIPCDPLACILPGPAHDLRTILVASASLLLQDLPSPRTGPMPLLSAALAGGFLPLCHLRSPDVYAGCLMFSDQKLMCFPPDGSYFLNIVGLLAAEEQGRCGNGEEERVVLEKWEDCGAMLSDQKKE